MSDNQVFPHVGTVPTKGVNIMPNGPTDREFVTARTERGEGSYRQEAEVHVYWHIPEDGGEPYLMVEVDDFTGLPMKVMVNEAVHYNTSTDIEEAS